jgi:type I restriction enzyme, S subunit
MVNHQPSIKRYQVYKDSAIAWLGNVPEHWSLSRIKSLTKTKSGTTPQSGLSQYYDNGIYFWVRTTDLNNNKLYSSEFKVTELAREHYSLISIPVGSVLLAMYGGMGTIGKNAILQKEVTINQSVCAIFPNNKKFFSKYLWYYIQYFRPHWEIFADSARKDPNINQEAIKRLWVNLPPLSEQKTIAHYLDTKTAQIDRKIDLLTQKATQYGNLKQSLINATVTRGLDKSVPMKDSAIEWIGEVPEHWEVRRIKDCTEPNTSAKIPIYFGDMDLVEFIPMTNIDEQLGVIKEFNLVPLKDVSSGYTKFRNGDIIFAKITPCMENGNVALVSNLQHNIGFGSTEFMVFRSSKKLLEKYLHYFLHNFLFRKNAEPFMKGTAGQKRITSLHMTTHYFGLPPLSEQKAIAHYLDTKTAQIDKIIQTLNTQIEKLKELRKTLINDIVTGKIRVIEDDPSSHHS